MFWWSSDVFEGIWGCCGGVLRMFSDVWECLEVYFGFLEDV